MTTAERVQAVLWPRDAARGPARGRSRPGFRESVAACMSDVCAPRSALRIDMAGRMDAYVFGAVKTTQYAADMCAQMFGRQAFACAAPPSAAITAYTARRFAGAPRLDSQGASARVKATLRRCAALTHAVRSLVTASIGAPAMCGRVRRM